MMQAIICSIPQVDPVVTNQFLQFFRETIDSKGSLHVDQLFELTSNHFNVDLWSTLFKTPQDLCTFLKIYSHLFHVQANIITLVPQKSYAPVLANTQAPSPISRFNTTSPLNQNLIPQQHNKEPLSPKHSGCSSNGSSSPITNKIDSPRDNPASLNQQTLKQRVNMVVMRMIAQVSG